MNRNLKFNLNEVQWAQWVIFHIVLSVPICIIAVNGAPVSESEKKYESIIKLLHTAPGC